MHPSVIDDEKTSLEETHLNWTLKGKWEGFSSSPVDRPRAFTARGPGSNSGRRIKILQTRGVAKKKVSGILWVRGGRRG